MYEFQAADLAKQRKIDKMKEEEGDETYIPPMYKIILDDGSPGGLVRIFLRLGFDAEVMGNSEHITNNEIRESDRDCKGVYANIYKCYISSHNV